MSEPTINEDERRIERQKLTDRQRLQGLSPVAVDRGQLEALDERGQSENWTPEQYQAALSEIAQKSLGHLVDESDKPAA